MPGRNDGWDIWDWQVTCPHVQTSDATLGVDEDVPGQICLRGDSRGNPQCAICFAVFLFSLGRHWSRPTEATAP